MSSTSTQPTTSSHTSTPTPTALEDPSNVGRGGSTDFFGFLIAFVGLVLVFVVCGLGSRRRFVARRRAILTLGDMDPWAFVPPVQQTEPKYWEPSLVRGGDEWSTIMPLSVSALHNEAEREEGGQAPRGTPPHTFSLFPLSSWVPFVRANTGTLGNLPEGTGRHQTEKPPIDLEVQVEVVILLPSAPRLVSEELDRDELPEYQIGSVRVGWQGGRM